MDGPGVGGETEEMEAERELLESHIHSWDRCLEFGGTLNPNVTVERQAAGTWEWLAPTTWFTLLASTLRVSGISRSRSSHLQRVVLEATISCVRSQDYCLSEMLVLRATATASAYVRLQPLTGFAAWLGWLAVSPQPLLLRTDARKLQDDQPAGPAVTPQRYRFPKAVAFLVSKRSPAAILPLSRLNSRGFLDLEGSSQGT